MGCFNVACSLSNTPILSGDPCYLALLKKNFKPGLELMELHPFFSFETVEQGEYNDYGDLEGKNLIDEIDERFYFFVSEPAWKWAQERFSSIKLTEHDKIWNQNKPFLWWHLEIKRIIAAFHFTYRNPLSAYLWGSQFNELDDLDSLLKEVIKPRMMKLKNLYKKWEQE